MKPKISIIVPVYNRREFLVQCIESILGQTYQNIESIFVDDGSTDGAGEVLDQYSRQDSRMRVIHQENHGESHARNVGLRVATGDYIGFCDCDDWVEPNMYEVLAEKAGSEYADIAAGGWIKETGTETVYVKNHKPIETPFGRDQLLRYIYERDSYQAFAYMWDKIYRRDLLYEDARLRFNEDLALGGDVLFLGEVALRVKRGVYADDAFYHYRQLADSTSHAEDLRNLYDWIKAYELLAAEFHEKKVDAVVVDYVKRFLAYHASNATESAIRQNDVQYKKIFQAFMMKYRDEYEKLNKGRPDYIARYRYLLEK